VELLNCDHQAFMQTQRILARVPSTNPQETLQIVQPQQTLVMIQLLVHSVQVLPLTSEAWMEDKLQAIHDHVRAQG
jgi:hypothetical protein